MDTPTSLVPTSSRRGRAALPETGFGSVYFQPNRLDVLVHLLAFEQLAGEESTPSAHNWVSMSDEFATRDNEPTVATLAAELMTSPEADLTVTFASGGQLVRGASAAAVAIGSGRTCVRRDGGDKVIDRSIVGLAEAGWTTEQLRDLLVEWARRDEAAAVVLVNLDADGADEAIHELTCRFAVMHNELDYVSADDAERLAASSSGSTQILCLRAGETLDATIERHGSAIGVCVPGSVGANALSTLWRSDRPEEVSPEHTQRVRKMRRREMADQVLERVFGR